MNQFNQISRAIRRPKRGQFSGQNVVPALGGNIVAAKAFSRKQAVFNEKAQQYARQGVITTPGFLRIETLAPTSATSIFNFNTLDTSGVKTSTEKRLKLADSFTITDISFYLGTGSCTANAPTAAEYAKQKLNTFPNPLITGLTGGVADNLEAIYNGFLSLRIDTTTFIDSIPMRQFYRVGTSQEAVGSSATNNNQITRNEWPLSMYGKTDLLPTIELNGQANIEFAINLPTATVCSATTTGHFVNMVIVLQGFLNQGAATVQRNIQQRLR
jgi:hypothetical protein